MMITNYTLTDVRNRLTTYTYIGYRAFPSSSGDLILGKWVDKWIEYLELDTVLRFDGSVDGCYPSKSPFTSSYMNVFEESYLIGCIDDEYEVILKKWDKENLVWLSKTTISADYQICSNPSVDFNGYDATFIWEVEIDANNKEIWEYTITPDDNVLTPLKVSIIEGFNTYPVVKEHTLVSYINNGNKLVGFREGYASASNPASYTVYTAPDSIHSIDVMVRKGNIKTTGLFALTEGSNGDYKLSFKKRYYNEEIWPVLKTIPADTEILLSRTSPISDYTEGTFPVERLSTTIPIIDTKMSYMIKLTTDDKNPHIPQIVMINDEVIEVIYGGNDIIETEIKVPESLIEDNMITLSIDRKKGSPNRTVALALYSYEPDEEIEISENTSLSFQIDKKLTPISRETLSINYEMSIPRISYSIPETGNLQMKIVDVTGRTISTIYDGIISKGAYTYSVDKLACGVYFTVMEYNGNVSRGKFILIK